MKQRGFSLLEVLVAVTLIGIGFSVVFAGISGSLRSLQRAEATDRRVELARYKLSELDLLKRIRPNDSASGTFNDGTRWTFRTFPYIPPVTEGSRPNPASLVRVELTLEWDGRNGTQKQVVETYRYDSGDASPVPSLEDQLREIE